MHTFQHKKSLIKKITQIGGSTLASRFLGIIREILTTRYLTAGAISDAFIAAFKIPNSLRKVFAEGAISGASVPSLVRIIKHENMLQASRFTTLLVSVIQTIVFLICLAVAWHTRLVLQYTVPGFDEEQLVYAIPLLRILIFFILPISFAAILGSSLQAVHNFFIPALAPVIYNIAFILSLCACIYFGLSIYYFSYLVLLAGLLYALVHLIAYRKAGFTFAVFDKSSYKHLGEVIIKFLPTLFTVGVVELNSYVDTYMGSELEKGTITLMYYAHRFSGIPLGVFGVAFSTIFLPYFSHISMYAPRRLGFFMHEALKLIFYITIPLTALFVFFSYDIYNTLFGSSFSPQQIVQAGQFLAIASLAIFSHSANKILLSLFYSLNSTKIPTAISVFATGVHMLLNSLFKISLQAKGFLLAGVIASMMQTFLYLGALQLYFKYPLYMLHLFRFLRGMLFQLAIFGLCFYQGYSFLGFLVGKLPASLAYFFTNSIGLWLWVGPLAGIMALGMFFSRKSFGVKLYFLD